MQIWRHWPRGGILVPIVKMIIILMSSATGDSPPVVFGRRLTTYCTLFAFFINWSIFGWRSTLCALSRARPSWPANEQYVSGFCSSLTSQSNSGILLTAERITNVYFLKSIVNTTTAGCLFLDHPEFYFIWEVHMGCNN